MKLPRFPGEDAPIVAEVDAAVDRLELGRRSAELDRAPVFPWKEWRALGDAGLLGLRTPVRLGGRGLALAATALALHRFGYRAGTTFAKLSLQPEFSSVLGEHGAPELIDRYFRPMLRGETLVANHVTEPSAGSDARGLVCRASRRGDRYVLSGTKSQAAFAADAHAAIVYARTDGAAGMTAFLVPQDLPGIRRSITSDLGERWMRRGTVVYDQVEIPQGHRIGEEGCAFEYLRDELTRERALLASIYLGVARASWEETVVHVGTRRAFGRPLAEQEAVAFPLVESWARLDAAWLFTASVLARLEAGEPSDAPAALAKWMATDVALATIDRAIQFHGGRGYSQELPHEQRWRDVRSGSIAHGPSEIMHLVAQRQLWPRVRRPSADPPTDDGRPT